MANLYKNFPHGLDDGMLLAAVNEYADAIFTSKADINVVLQLSPLVQLGQYELQKRAFERSNRLATRTGYMSLGIALIAVLISIGGTWSSSKWEDRQMSRIDELVNTIHGMAEEQKSTRAILEDSPRRFGEVTASEIAKHLTQMNAAPRKAESSKAPRK